MKKYLLFSLLVALVAMAFIRTEKYTLTGKITDDQGNPVAAAAVMIKRTKTGTTTNNAGNFKLLVSGNETLVVSSINFQTQEIKINKRKSITVNLIPFTMAIDEVVVTGLASANYGAAADYYSPSFNYSTKEKVYSLAAGNRYYDDKRKGDIYIEHNTEGYDAIVENSFLKAKDNPLSTFSIDVDAASYSNVRRFINEGQLPPAGAVRIEEMINYFTYDYPQPENDAPFTVNMEASECPWNSKHQLVLIGVQGKKIANENLPPANLVFLVDVSGSMDEPNKLPLVQSSMKLLAEQLRPQDKVSIVVYAGNAGLVLPSTQGNKTGAIKAAIEQLQAGGSTAGGEGIKLAYKIAREHFIKDGNNRVILCTDGDFNVGVSSDDDLVRLIEKERTSGVYLTVLGFGMGNYQDAKMQKLADKGNGNHAYIDNISEARKVLVKEAGGTLFTIAKDVKLQVEFNPLKVQGYRLIGYENRMLAKEDFNDDAKDAGELGSGHTVTALYEIIPVGVKASELKDVDSLRYKVTEEPFSENSFSDELMYVKMRFKQPGSEVSKLVEFPLKDHLVSLSRTSLNFRFAAAVAQFGMILRGSKYKGVSGYDLVYDLASKALGKDKDGYRKEFLELVEKASEIK